MGDSPNEELHDLDADPWAVKNLADDPTHAKSLIDMRAEMQIWRERTNDREIHRRDVPRRVK